MGRSRSPRPAPPVLPGVAPAPVDVTDMRRADGEDCPRSPRTTLRQHGLETDRRPVFRQRCAHATGPVEPSGPEELTAPRPPLYQPAAPEGGPRPGQSGVPCRPDCRARLHSIAAP